MLIYSTTLKDEIVYNSLIKQFCYSKCARDINLFTRICNGIIESNDIQNIQVTNSFDTIIQDIQNIKTPLTVCLNIYGSLVNYKDNQIDEKAIEFINQVRQIHPTAMIFICILKKDKKAKFTQEILRKCNLNSKVLISMDEDEEDIDIVFKKKKGLLIHGGLSPLEACIWAYRGAKSYILTTSTYYCKQHKILLRSCDHECQYHTGKKMIDTKLADMFGIKHPK